MDGALAIVVAGVALLVVLAVVLVRQGSPGKLAEQQNKAESQELHVVDRPAGPDAEPMGADAGQPSTDPDTLDRGRGGDDPPP